MPLFAEGKALQHCVAGYYAACYAGHNPIVSLRDANGILTSTVEFSFIKGTLKVVQHHSHYNGRPDATGKAAAQLSSLRPHTKKPWSSQACPPSAAVAITAPTSKEFQYVHVQEVTAVLSDDFRGLFRVRSDRRQGRHGAEGEGLVGRDAMA
ncbi:PcfJ domain-containing protein [Ensifer sp. ENS02]|nr:PcfJ domain-containing protein [Ensifer sp. ENS02]